MESPQGLAARDLMSNMMEGRVVSRAGRASQVWEAKGLLGQRRGIGTLSSANDRGDHEEDSAVG